MEIYCKPDYTSLISQKEPPQRESVWIEIISPTLSAILKSSSQLLVDLNPNGDIVFTSAIIVKLFIMINTNVKTF